MKSTLTLIRIQHGSHLYGTNTESSDLDFKGVFLPAGRDILLQRVPGVIDRRIKVSTSVKNTKEDVDDQSYPLQKFIKMVTSGDTTGTEILFAPQSAIIDMSSDWQIIRDNKHLLLNKQCKGFVGYCQRQAAKYGIKGSRMAACKAIVELLEPAVAKHGTSAKLSIIHEALEAFCEEHEFSGLIELQAQSNGPKINHLEVVDRKVPYTTTIKAAYDIFAKVFANYGERTRQAMDNEGIDWKAVSHAVRVSQQAIELLSTGHITFPRPEADLLLKIKRGELDYKLVAPMLEELVEQVDAASHVSNLPGKSDQGALDEIVLGLHQKQLV